MQSTTIPRDLPRLLPDSDSSDCDDDVFDHPAIRMQDDNILRLRIPASSLTESLKEIMRNGISLNSAPPVNVDASTREIPSSKSDSEDDNDPETAAHKADFRRELLPLFEADRDYTPNPKTSQPLPSSRFPFAMPSQPRAEHANEPWRSLRLDGSFFPDGGSRQRNGSCAFVGYHKGTVYLEAQPLKRGESTNNVAEFKALLNALQYACGRKLKRILIVTDSQLVADFLKGANRISQKHLLAITQDIIALLPAFSAIYVSRIPSHQDICIENDVADALCTWAMGTEKSLTFTVHPHYVVPYTDKPPTLALGALPSRMLSKLRADPKSAPPPANACTVCLKTADHKAPTCPIERFASLSSFNSEQHCLGCLSHHHETTSCPLFAQTGRRPSLSSLISTEMPPIGETLRTRAADLFATDLDALHFPNNCSRKQFADYYATVALALEQAATPAEVQTAQKAWRLWCANYRFDGLTIKRSRPHRPYPDDTGDNFSKAPVDKFAELAKRALRAARLIPLGARVSDVSKALRTGDKVTLSEDIKRLLSQCYPRASPDEATVFEPKPLPHFAVDRDALARLVMSRSPYSHPGATGISFDALQNFCRWTYKLETEDHPDYRWDIFCRLVSKIMAGRAVALSDMLLDVIGACFDKNAENDKPFALRNLGIEESILRISAALVFEKVLPKALNEQFLTDFDLGAGRKAGAEIFGRIGATLARGGAAIAVFDVVKAFNHLRRSDLMAAVADFDHPLLTAFVHFLFSKNSVVTFTCPKTGDIFITLLDKGIHQGNPLSVFLFSLTVAYILRPFRKAHPHALVATFVDDMQLAVSKPAFAEFPALLAEFIALFAEHGLCFDLSDSAKSSVYTVTPLPLPIQRAINLLGMRCQNDGITPCKIAHGTPAFMDAHAAKALTKLRIRFQAFDALWPVLLDYDRSRKKPSNRVYEPYLNLVRLSFISMSTYVLRTLHPSKCAAYCQASTEWGLKLIRNVFPKFIQLPPSHTPNDLPYPDLLAISARILQLPLTRGGLSLRLAASIKDICYVASCLDCYPMMFAAAHHLNIRCAQFLIPELLPAQRRISATIPELSPAFFKCFDDFENALYKEQLQKLMTKSLNAAEIESIATTLTPWPMYADAFNARTDKTQDHVSWPLNAPARFRLGLAPLNDSEFSRSISIAALHPVIAPRTCGCGQPLDPAAFHLLHCRYNSYCEIHDCVKFSIAARVKSFVNRDLAPMTVLTEQPVIRYYGLRDPSAPEGTTRVADLVLSLHADAQQQPVICDLVSCHSRGQQKGDYMQIFEEVARRKLAIYSKYNITADNSFWPLPFGRTNVLPSYVLQFCDFIARHFPTQLNAARKLRASFSRSISVGVARTINTAIRRLQLSTAARVGVSSVSTLCLREPFAPSSPRRSIPKPPQLSLRTEQRICARLAVILKGSSEDLSSPLQLSSGRLCVAADTAVVD